MNTHAIEPAAIAARPGLTYVWQKPCFIAGMMGLVAVAIQTLWIPIDADVSWLITVCERVIAGDRLYIDILEVNPPASVWMYLPLVGLAELFGAKPEAVVAAAFVAAGFASAVATVRLASRLYDDARPVLLAGVLSFICLVLPMALFAQREHAALLLALPSLAVMALLAERRPLSPRILYGSGFAAGLVIVIKPYFLLAILAPALWVWLKRGSLTPLLPPIAAASAAIALYAAALFAFAGAYLDWLPVITRTYGPMHEVFWKVAIGPALYPAICLMFAVLLRPRGVPAVAMVWALGAVGFLVAAYLQAKNYPNHWLPQAALALAAVASMLSSSTGGSARPKIIAAGLAVVAMCEMFNWTILPDPGVDAVIRQNAPPAPKIIALSGQLVTGHPVTRNVGGEWVGSRAALFTATAARFVGLDDPVVQQSYREDIRSFAADVRRERPDVVLVHTPAKPWMMREPEIARAMGEYRFEARSGKTEIWLRHSPQP